jgi:hypothetical protein
VEDAHLRDLLKTHAYRSNVVLDASFSSEIVTIRWPAYERKALPTMVSMGGFVGL